MAKIDLEKLICSVAKRKYFSEEKLQDALKEQDLEYKDGEIVEIQKPKFKVGDWVVNNQTSTIYLVKSIRDDKYCLWPLDAKIEGFLRIVDVDSEYHLWTIEDAKDGDVLACGDKVTDCPFIFHNLTEELNPRSYCGVNTLRHFQDNDENGGSWCELDEVRPATKEQRDILFQKMKEAGYEWDAEKKELKKVEPADEIGRKFKVGDIVQYITDSTDRRKIGGVDTLCDMYTTDSSPIMFEVEDEWKVVVNAEDVEQNPAPEPKFKVGDWVVDNHGEVNQVTSVTDDSYGFTLYDGTYVSGCWKDYYHHWTIEDAKEGDVLAFDTSEHIILVKETHNSAWGWRLSCWCHVLESEFEVVEYHTKSEGLRPATKEQHDLLFQKMKEAGYEWDDEKKELRKIEQELANSYCQKNCKGFKETGKCFADWDCKAKREAESIDKAESKFHEGDWVVKGNTIAQILDIQEQYYVGLDIEGNDFTTSKFLSDDKIHLWTIQDAKDGDVLYSPTHHLIWIYKDDKHYHACINLNYTSNNVSIDGSISVPNDVCPAIAKERTILFAKIKEAGYEWDADKKELKKIRKPLYGRGDIIEYRGCPYFIEEVVTPKENIFYYNVVSLCFGEKLRKSIGEASEKDIILISNNRFDYEQADIQQKDFTPKATTANRQLYNRAILKILSDYVEKYPDTRFVEMLCNLGFHLDYMEESQITYLDLNKIIDKQK